MTMKEMKSLSDEELKIMSMEKDKKGNNTIDANRAMRVRRERGGFWDDINTGSPSLAKTLFIEQGNWDYWRN